MHPNSEHRRSLSGSRGAVEQDNPSPESRLQRYMEAGLQGIHELHSCSTVKVDSEKIRAPTPRVPEATCRLFKSRISILRWGISCFSILLDTQSCSPTNKKSWCKNSIRLFERPTHEGNSGIARWH